MFQYIIYEDGQTIEELLRDYWRLGKKQIHELRMNKAVYKDGEPTMWKTEQPQTISLHTTALALKFVMKTSIA